jgi:RNA 2',3'-cyclic 3'-phosphodiesterase
LTLKFLGSIPGGRVSEFHAALEKPAAESEPFRLGVKSLGCFPSVRAPRIVWAGLCGEMKPLEHLQRLVVQQMEKLGVGREERSFRPHSTLGRVGRLNFRESERVGTVLRAQASESFGEWFVQEIHLMRSNLSSSGAQYESIKCFKLGEGRLTPLTRKGPSCSCPAEDKPVVCYFNEKVVDRDRSGSRGFWSLLLVSEA